MINYTKTLFIDFWFATNYIILAISIDLWTKYLGPLRPPTRSLLDGINYSGGEMQWRSPPEHDQEDLKAKAKRQDTLCASP